MTDASMTFASNAKINIGLRILGKRKDGYHDIETIFQEIDLHDVITLTRKKSGIDIICDSPLVPCDSRNLAWQAAEILKNKFSIDEGIKISIEKKIPVGAGLGGGSSNAAGVLKRLSHFWKLGLSKKNLLTMAAQLGSDVPFFIYGGTASGLGRGEILKQIEYEIDFSGLLVYPNIEISTKWCYKNFNLCLTNTKKYVKLAESFLKNIKLRQFSEIFTNDLEGVAFNRYPALRELKNNLLLAGAEFASMSGSGSSIYGLFNSNFMLQKIKGEFNKTYKVFIIKPIRRRSPDNKI